MALRLMGEHPKSIFLKQTLHDTVLYCDTLYKEYGVKIYPTSLLSFMCINVDDDYDAFVSRVRTYMKMFYSDDVLRRLENMNIIEKFIEDNPEYTVIEYKDLFRDSLPTGTFLDNYTKEIQEYHAKNVEIYKKWMEFLGEECVEL